jgi:hypothetical protein
MNSMPLLAVAKRGRSAVGSGQVLGGGSDLVDNHDCGIFENMRLEMIWKTKLVESRRSESATTR